MTYVLEKITPIDRKRIIEDAGKNTNVQSTLIYAEKHQRFPKTWAVDRTNNRYLVRMPNVIREDSENRSFLFFFECGVQRFHIKGWFGSLLDLGDSTIDSDDFMILFQKEVTKAFSIYGEQGNGPLNESGAPEFEMVPVFQVR
jgi:hypothetical protein